MPQYSVFVINDSISTLSKSFQKWADDVNTTIQSLNQISIVPGDFSDANDLKTLVTNRTDSLHTFLTNIHKTLTGVSTDLSEIVQNNSNTENHNKITVTDLETLLNDTEKNLPGVSKYK
jgi:hypothetical protein